MGVAANGCRSKVNDRNRPKNNKRYEVQQHNNGPKNVKKRTENDQPRPFMLLIHGFINDRKRMNVRIEQRILLFLDIPRLSMERIDVHLNAMKRDLRKNYDEGGIEVISEIIPKFLWIGNEADSKNMSLLKRLKITHVLNCSGLDIQNDYSSDIKQCIINAEDESDFGIITAYLDDCFEFIHDCKRLNGRILVHCMMGMNRSVVIVVAYLMYAQNMNVLKAVNYIAVRRGWILQNESFREQLIDYANKINRLKY